MTIRTRPALAGLAALLSVAALAPASAHAFATPTQKLDVAATLLDQPAGRPWAVSLTIGATLGTVDGSVGAPVKSIALKFPNATVNGGAFPTCTAAILRQKGPGSCPARSRLGTGSAQVDVRPLLDQLVTADLTVFNGPGTDASRKILLLAQAKQFEITIVMEGTLKRTGGRYGYTLSLPIPPLNTIPGAPPAAIHSFSVDVGGRATQKGQKVSFIEAPRVCPKSGLPFAGTFVYTDGQTGTAASTISCTLRGS
jgi:hypothetical protein